MHGLAVVGLVGGATARRNDAPLRRTAWVTTLVGGWGVLGIDNRVGELLHVRQEGVNSVQARVLRLPALHLQQRVIGDA
jgi:hypothetical protein